jgi:hypothetical protein
MPEPLVWPLPEDYFYRAMMLLHWGGRVYAANPQPHMVIKTVDYLLLAASETAYHGSNCLNGCSCHYRI